LLTGRGRSHGGWLLLGQILILLGGLGHRPLLAWLAYHKVNHGYDYLQGHQSKHGIRDDAKPQTASGSCETEKDHGGQQDAGRHCEQQPHGGGPGAEVHRVAGVQAYGLSGYG